jgi:hypothetical protein
MTLKIALLAPIPRARVRTVIDVKPGFRRNILTANFRSCQIVVILQLPLIYMCSSGSPHARSLVNASEPNF